MGNKKFIVLEGCEGSGKTTLGLLIVDFLIKNGQKAIFTREPGGVDVAETIRSVILDNEITNMTEALLFTAARVEHLETKVKKYLDKGYFVICDRYMDSSIVYQGIGKDLGIAYIKNLNLDATNNFVADKTIYLDIDPKIGISRVMNNSREVNRFDQLDLEFHNKIREGYLDLYSGSTSVYTLDATLSSKELLEQSMKVILDD